MNAAPPRRLRVLAVHRGLLQRRDESAEVEEQLCGLVAAGVDVYGSDGRFLYRAVRAGDRLEYCAQGRLTLSAIRSVDVVHIHMPIPLAHIAVGVGARLLGVPVALSPAGMLGDAYAESAWFGGRRQTFSRAKPLIVKLLRRLWRHVAVVFICLGRHEAQDARLPPDRTTAVPWPKPQTWVDSGGSGRDDRSAGPGPVAFVSRMDIHRKGIDLLAAWLLRYADELPRPAAVLFAPDNGQRHEGLEEARRRGLVEWDRVARGPMLRARLAGCRGVALLSRWEAFPRALREAALLGLPTISPPEAQFADIVPRVGAGAVVDPGDPHAVQRAFVQIAQERGDTRVASALFDREAIGSFLAAVLGAVADGRPPTRSYYDWRDEQVAS